MLFVRRGFILSSVARCRTLPARSFSISPYRKAAEFQTEAFEALKKTQTFQKISQNPAAVSAIQKLAEVMQNSGIEPGTKPTTLQMMKLAAKSEFREASKNMMQEFQNSGVDLNSKDVQEELQSIAKAMVTTKT